MAWRRVEPERQRERRTETRARKQGRGKRVGPQRQSRSSEVGWPRLLREVASALGSVPNARAPYESYCVRMLTCGYEVR